MIIGLLAIGLGGLVGMFSAILGIGGGLVMVPLLPTVFTLNSHEAVATSLFTILLVVANNSIGFARKNLIVWPVALLIGPLTAVGSFTSGILAQSLSHFYLRFILALLISSVLVKSLFGYFGKNKRDPISNAPMSSFKKTGISSFVGIFAGVLSGLSGIGSGAVVSPLLAHLGLVENKMVSPTANAVMLFTTAFGAGAFMTSAKAIQNWKIGYIHVDLALLMAIGAFLTSIWARQIQEHIYARWRSGLLIILLTFLAMKMWAEFL
ncbi:MAG: sulfite exporter TauE/SafE family protein [Bdellovibrionales bacterium]|nr:sulfite exporter TauE/SafE family protein [Bdellovibrionales bacterium]